MNNTRTNIIGILVAILTAAILLAPIFFENSDFTK